MNGKRRGRNSDRGKGVRVFALMTTILIAGSLITLGMPVRSLAGSENNAKAQVINLTGKYNSKDTCVIKAVDTGDKTISFRNLATGRDYTLSYDNTSFIYDGYGRSLSAALLETGKVVDISFLSASKHLNTLVINNDAFDMTRFNDYKLNAEDNRAVISGSNYKLSDNALILIDGHTATSFDVLPSDQIRVSGIGSDIYCVEVLRGHGYVSLSSADVDDNDLTGAVLQIGDRIMHRVSDNMLVSAPEGTYDVSIKGRGADYTTTLTVKRDKETVVDTGEVEISYQTGMVTFETLPEETDLKIDGEEVMTGVPLELKYGDHYVEASADGYKKVKEYLHVGSGNSEVEIELQKDSDKKNDKDDDEDADSDSDNGDDSSNAGSKASSDNASTVDKKDTDSLLDDDEEEDRDPEEIIEGEDELMTGYNVYVDGPDGAELFLDGAYIGVIPTSFTKVTGNHTVTIRKRGYRTRSFSISLSPELTDKTYRFPDLEPEEDNSENNSGSGNSADASNGNSGKGSSSGGGKNDGDDNSSGEGGSVSDNDPD
ncbi:PEGA domain-containing protein [Butyrivibrio sp. MC2013]|uniref:PEGA domain-containing protein n=1 Tax=Butyrivibrio sp. MC2013 TaxID=1280686 RepID=UPI00041BBA85|nr:PEGA domain-containing protein [Butyrivibrio sp. MC2013]